MATGSRPIEIPGFEFDEKTVQKKWKNDSSVLMTDWKKELSSIKEFSAAEIETSFKSFLSERELGIGAVLPLFRLLVTGQGMGPSMFDIAEFLGKEECLTRIDSGISTLNGVKQ